MTEQDSERGVTRRDFLAVGVGVAALRAGDRPERVLAQAGPSSAQPSPPGTVKVERLPGGVLLVGIDRPHAQNRLDAPIIIGLGQAYHQLEHDDELRVAVLHGVGRDFCVGLDVAAFTAAQAAGVLPPKNPDFINPLGLRPPFRSRPVVVAVQGGTKYVGHELFLATDIRVAATDTVFSQGEVTRGVFPAGGATVRLTREIGWGNAMRYMLTGEEWDAEEARRLGLVQEVTEPGKQLDRAVAIATKIATNAPLGVRATLASARRAVAGEDAELAAVSGEFARILQSDDAREAQRALREGRQPVYRGK